MGNKSSKKKLPKEDLEFLCSNTKFSKSEIKDWYRGFMVGATYLLTNCTMSCENLLYHSSDKKCVFLLMLCMLGKNFSSP